MNIYAKFCLSQHWGSFLFYKLQDVSVGMLHLVCLWWYMVLPLSVPPPPHILSEAAGKPTFHDFCEHRPAYVHQWEFTSTTKFELRKQCKVFSEHMKNKLKLV